MCAARKVYARMSRRCPRSPDRRLCTGRVSAVDTRKELYCRMRRRPAQIFPENPGPGVVAQPGGDIDIPGPHGIFRICGICGEGEVSEICGWRGWGARTSRNHQNECRQNPRPNVVDSVRKMIVLGLIVVRGPCDGVQAGNLWCTPHE